MAASFNIVRKGYDTALVDEQIKRYEEQIAYMETKVNDYKENEQKLEDALQTFINKEASINNAIINAQISADNILLNAKTAAENIVQNAKKQAQATEDITNRRLHDIMRALSYQRQDMQDIRNEYDKVIMEFRKRYDTVLTNFLQTSDNGDFNIVDEKINSFEAQIKTMLSEES